MTIRLSVCPLYSSNWTDIIIEGEHETSVANILVSRLQVSDYEVLIEDADGDFIPFEDYEQLNEEDDDDKC